MPEEFGRPWLAEERTTNRSYCGEYCYDINIPQKTFSGHHAAMPASYVTKALDRMQQGGATEGQAHSVSQRLVPKMTNDCSARCQQNFTTCLAKTQALRMEDVSLRDWSSCISSHTLCGSACGESSKSSK